MIHKMIFNLDNEGDEEALRLAMKASAMDRAFWDIGQEIFRPARKHGYSDGRLTHLTENQEVVEAIGLLEQKYYEILERHGVNND